MVLPERANTPRDTLLFNATAPAPDAIIVHKAQLSSTVKLTGVDPEDAENAVLFPTYHGAAPPRRPDVSLVRSSLRGSRAQINQMDSIRRSIVAQAEQTLTRFNAGVRALQARSVQKAHAIAEMDDDDGSDLTPQAIADTSARRVHIPQSEPAHAFSPRAASSRVNALAAGTALATKADEPWSRDPRPRSLPLGPPGGDRPAHGAELVRMRSPVPHAALDSSAIAQGLTHARVGHGAVDSSSAAAATTARLSEADKQARAHQAHLDRLLAKMRSHEAGPAVSGLLPEDGGGMLLPSASPLLGVSPTAEAIGSTSAVATKDMTAAVAASAALQPLSLHEQLRNETTKSMSNHRPDNRDSTAGKRRGHPAAAG